jgi:hypothetical protein
VILIDRRLKVDIHIDSKAGIGKLELIDEAKSLIEVRVLKLNLRIDGLERNIWSDFLLLVRIEGGLHNMLLLMLQSLIRVSFIYLLGLHLFLIFQLVRYS